MQVSLRSEPQHRYRHRINSAGMSLIPDTVIDAPQLEGRVTTVMLDNICKIYCFWYRCQRYCA